MHKLVNPANAVGVVLDNLRSAAPVFHPLATATGLVLAEELSRPDTLEWPIKAAQPGCEVNSLVIGLAASQGRRWIRVIPPPSVAIVTAGQDLDQVLSGAETSRQASLGQMLQVAVHRCGIRRASLSHAADTVEDLAFIMEHVGASDVILVVGGVDKGPNDLLPQLLMDEGTEILFHGVSQCPGGSLLFASRQGKPLFGLPQDPTGALLCYFRYVAPALRQMMKNAPLPSFIGCLDEPLRLASKQMVLLLARAQESGHGYRVHPMTDGANGQLANTYFCLPPGDHALEAGSEVTCRWLA